MTFTSQVSSLYEVQLGPLVISPEAAGRSTATSGGVVYITTPNVNVVRIDGLLALPNSTTQARKRLQTHGLREGDTWLDDRTVTIVFETWDETDSSGDYTTSALEDLLAATKPTERSRLFFKLPTVAGGDASFIECRVARRAVRLDPNHTYGLNEVTVELVAADPRVYSATQSTGGATLPAVSGGLTFPVSPPIVFSDVNDGGTINAANSGNFDAPVTFTLYGPLTYPSIVHNGLDKTITYADTIASGDFVVVDTSSRTVMLNGAQNRYHLLSESEWFDLVPGDNEILFRSTTTGGGNLSAAWRSTSI